MRILVLEDEPQLARHVVRALERHGHEATACLDGAEGFKKAHEYAPNLIVLDLNLPNVDGLTILAQLKESRHPARVIILTARGDVEYRISGLKAGADDYLAKPFSMEELIARIDALGRRGQASAPEEYLRVSDLQVDLQSRRVTRAAKPISLSPREFDLLLVLAKEPGRVFSRTELCERVWQRDYDYDSRSVEVLINRLRKKVDSEGSPALLHTIRYIGYTLRAGDPATPEDKSHDPNP
jgi:DNA-binding response OmpR family regulator